MRNVCFSDIYIFDHYENEEAFEAVLSKINKFIDDVSSWLDSKELCLPEGWDMESFAVMFHYGLLGAIDLRDIDGLANFDQYVQSEELSELRNYIEEVTNSLDSWDIE